MLYGTEAIYAFWISVNHHRSVAGVLCSLYFCCCCCCCSCSCCRCFCFCCPSSCPSSSFTALSPPSDLCLVHSCTAWIIYCSIASPTQHFVLVSQCLAKKDLSFFWLQSLLFLGPSWIHCRRWFWCQKRHFSSADPSYKRYWRRQTRHIAPLLFSHTKKERIPFWGVTRLISGIRHLCMPSYKWIPLYSWKKSLSELKTILFMC